MNEALERVVNKEVTALGLELYELRVGGSGGSPLLDVRIERADGEKVTVEDCARVSRALEAKLDAGRIVGEKYTLEVSSPGVERSLRNARDWAKFAGRTAVVTSDAVGGSQELEIVGVEGDAGAETVILKDARGEERRIPLAAVKRARLVFHWKR